MSCVSLLGGHKWHLFEELRQVDDCIKVIVITLGDLLKLLPSTVEGNIHVKIHTERANLALLRCRQQSTKDGCNHFYQMQE
jgi:regulator of replication initiation timing